jgi:hypothetical protein
MPISHPDIAQFAVPGFFYDKIVWRGSGSVSANGFTVGPLALGVTNIEVDNTYGKKMPVFVQASLDNSNWYLFGGPYGSFSIDFVAAVACTDLKVKLRFLNGGSARTIYWRAFGVHLWPS